VETRPAQKGAYLRIRPDDKARWKMPLLDDLDLVFLEGEFCVYEAGEDVEKLLRLIPGDMFGPPEKCYYRHVSDHPALLWRKHGKGAAACFPFGIGTHYAEQAHQGHAALLLGAVDHLLGPDRRVRVSGSPLVEVNHRADPGGRFEWISLYNHSGQRGSALHEPIPIAGIGIRFMPKEPVRSVRLLRADRECTFTAKDDGPIALTLPPLEHYEIVVFEYQQ
jgi:hypothetical protein